MSFDLQTMLESTRAFRRKLAARPIAEKLRVLDALRACTSHLRQDPSSVAHEDPSHRSLERAMTIFHQP